MPLLINDMGVLSRNMIITKDNVVSDKQARPITDTDNIGFSYFHEYVINDVMKMDNWEIKFSVSDNSTDGKGTYTIHCNTDVINGKQSDILLYKAENISKSLTYQLTLYIIERLSNITEGEWHSDNFESQVYELTRDDE